MLSFHFEKALNSILNENSATTTLIMIAKKGLISNFPSGATSMATIPHHFALKLTVTVDCA